MPDFDKLPKWAKDHIRNIERERDNSIRKLNEFVDSQTPSPVYVDEFVSTGEEGKRGGPSIKRQYIQTRNITIEDRGMEVDIYVTEDGIRIGYSGNVMLVPTSYRQIMITNREDEK